MWGGTQYQEIIFRQLNSQGWKPSCPEGHCSYQKLVCEEQTSIRVRELVLGGNEIG